MYRYRLSRLAESDLAGIADYTIRQFGIKQARRYRDGLEKIFLRLAEYPNSGRSAGHLASRLRRMNFESHVIFFLHDEDGVLIVRILHQRMAFKRHPMTDDEPS
ncbi:MAG TPA: type II toxin-antitoxin system RelE/ParE family toxin [Verrucomicrobiae bacterium]|nr:type II toxin-antitoxin system RelE/ParE family toxin [Verrucomicrobiae bacterium]